MLNALVGYGFGMDMTQNVMGHFSERIDDIMAQGLATMPKEYINLLNEVETHELFHP